MSLSLKSFDFTATIIFSPPPIRERSIVMTVSLCIWKYKSDLFHFFVHVTHGRDSVLL